MPCGICKSIHKYQKLIMTRTGGLCWLTSYFPLNETWVFLKNGHNYQSGLYTPVLRTSPSWTIICPIQWAVLQSVIIISYYQVGAKYVYTLTHLQYLPVYIVQDKNQIKPSFANWMYLTLDPLGLHHKGRMIGQTNSQRKD